jgi:lactate permease
VLLSRFSFEFPTLIGGSVGLALSVIFAKMGIGLEKSESKKEEQANKNNVTKALFPLWGSVLLLAITRIKHLKIKGLLLCDEPSFNLELGSFAKFRLGPACVICLKDIYGTTQGWCLKALFVPAIIPFFVISLLCIFIFKLDRKTTATIWKDTWDRLKMPIIALMGALAMVNLLMVGGKDSCTAIIGRTFAETAGKNWQYCASFLGAVGSFFAGSNTVSNLTFGGIQESIAQSLNLDLTTILALQSVGGAMGNMVCINNIVAVCSILGVMAKEGYILKRTVIPMIIYGIIASIISCFL